MQSFMPNIGDPLTKYIKKEIRKKLKKTAEQSENGEKVIAELAEKLLDDDRTGNKMY